MFRAVRHVLRRESDEACLKSTLLSNTPSPKGRLKKARNQKTRETMVDVGGDELEGVDHRAGERGVVRRLGDDRRGVPSAVAFAVAGEPVVEGLLELLRVERLAELLDEEAHRVEQLVELESGLGVPTRW